MVVWRYKQVCKVCNGSGKQDADTACKICDGRGDLGKNDVTDVIEIPLPKTSDDIVVAPNVTGYVQPDIDTLEYYRKEQERFETTMEATLWGLDMVASRDETATGRFIDQQPIINKLDTLTNTAEWIYNQLAEMVVQWLMPTNDKVLYHRVFGRRFIIESTDALLEKYADGQEKGWNNVIMDNLLYQIIVSQYSTNRPLLEIELKKSRLEPYIHLPYESVNIMFGAKEAEKKVLFHEFWEGADRMKSEETLRTEFNKYVEDNSKVIVQYENSNQ